MAVPLPCFKSLTTYSGNEGEQQEALPGTKCALAPLICYRTLLAFSNFLLLSFE